MQIARKRFIPAPTADYMWSRSRPFRSKRRIHRVGFVRQLGEGDIGGKRWEAHHSCVANRITDPPLYPDPATGGKRCRSQALCNTTLRLAGTEEHQWQRENIDRRDREPDGTGPLLPNAAIDDGEHKRSND